MHTGALARTVLGLVHTFLWWACANENPLFQILLYHSYRNLVPEPTSSLTQICNCEFFRPYIRFSSTVSLLKWFEFQTKPWETEQTLSWASPQHLARGPQWWNERQNSFQLLGKRGDLVLTMGARGRGLCYHWSQNVLMTILTLQN